MVEEEERREVSIHLYRPYLASSDFALAGCLALDLLAQLVLHSTAESCKPNGYASAASGMENTAPAARRGHGRGATAVLEYS